MPAAGLSVVGDDQRTAEYRIFNEKTTVWRLGLDKARL